LQQKRHKQFKESIESFQKAIHTIDGRKKLDSYEQLAKLYEHQMKNYPEALQYTLKGIKMIQEADFFSDHQKKKLLENCDKRLQRF